MELDVAIAPFANIWMILQTIPCKHLERSQNKTQKGTFENFNAGHRPRAKSQESNYNPETNLITACSEIFLLEISSKISPTSDKLNPDQPFCDKNPSVLTDLDPKNSPQLNE